MVASWRTRWNQGRWSKTGSVVVLLLALLLTYSGTWTPAWGQESPLATPQPATPPQVFAPVVLPSISGTIRNGSGEPVAGLIVVAYRRQQNNWSAMRQATTNAAGEYRFPWMAAGTYRLVVRDPQGIYATTFYPDAADIEAANDIVVVGAALSGVDAAVGAGGQITGTLTWPDGPAPFDSTVDLYYVIGAPFTTQLTLNDDLTLPAELRQYRLVSSQSFTESVVNYTFMGLAAGRYRVCAQATALRSTLHECFDDAALGIHATDVVVATGATVADVAIELGDGADLATLTGTVTIADQTPASGVDVEVIPAPDVDFFAIPQSQRTTTNDAGQFAFNELPYGRYTVRFGDADGLYLPSNYRATATEAATVISLDRSAAVSITAVITPAGMITGNVTLDGSNAGMGGQVTAYALSESGWSIASTGNIVAATGAYTVTSLRGGSYRIQFGVDIPASIYYGPPGVTLEAATPITVVTGTTVGGINIDLTPYIAGIAFGSISGSVTMEGVAQPNMLVRVLDAVFDCCIAPPPLLTTVTDADGRFAVAGLPPGRYKLGISAADQPAPTLYAPDQRTFETAMIYTIGNPADGVARQSITDVNVVMGPTGSVARKVSRPDDTPVVGAKVFIYQRLGDAGNWPLVASTETNAEGQYRFAGLVPDIYQVCLVAEGIGEPSCGGGGGQGIGLDVVVTAGQEATGIDILDVP